MQIVQLMNMIRNSGNPQAMMNQIMRNNPQMQQIMNYVNQNGGDPKAAFYKLAEEKGIDPEEILSQLK